MLFNKKKLEDQISSTLYDLTHLEINTIIKDEMSASKAPSGPRLLLHNLAGKYDQKLVSMGDKYRQYLGKSNQVNDENLFRGIRVNDGSGYESFKELSDRAKNAGLLLKASKERGIVHEERKRHRS